MGLPIKEIVEEKVIESVYQPLWQVTNWNIYGYESLLRFPKNTNINPERLFEEAREQEFLYELDVLCLEQAINQFPSAYLQHHMLFLNIFPSTIIHERFAEFISRLVRTNPFIRGRIVFELNESIEERLIWEAPQFNQGIQVLKDLDFYIALDDFGVGTATLQRLLAIQPNYIKIDRFFAEDLALDVEKQKIVSLVSSFCKQNSIVILEGIEKDIDLAQAKLLQVPIVQGFLLGEPEKISTEKVWLHPTL